MFRKSVFIGLMILPAFLATGRVHAGWVSGSATVNSIDTKAPVNDVVTALAGFEGATSFTNDFTTGGTSAPSIGDTIYAVSGDYLTSYKTGTGGSQLVSFGNDYMMVVSALAGKITGISNGVLTATFTSGGFDLFLTPQTTFSVFDPTTWGATNSAGTSFSTPVATYSLVSAQQTFSGPNGALGDNFSPSQLNFAQFDPSNNHTTGNFLFKTDNNGNFLVENPSSIPPPGQSGDGILTHIDELAVTTGLSNYNYTGTGQAALNTIFSNIEGTSGAFSNYSPTGNGSNGDTIQIFGVNGDPGGFLVPEPASMMLFGLGALGAAVGQVWVSRRNRKNAAAA